MPRKTPSRRTGKLPTDNSGPSTVECLCLVCRQIGHIAQSCPYLDEAKRRTADSTMFHLSPPFSSVTPPPIEGSGNTLCRRCAKLDIRLRNLPNAHPFVLDDKSPFHTNRADKKMTHIPSLGRVKSLRLLASCPLCRLIFDITYLSEKDIKVICEATRDSAGHLALVSAWTVHRLEHSLEWPEYQRGVGPYAKCIYTSVTSGEAYEHTILVDWALDAIGVMDSTEDSAEGPVLGVRMVDPRVPNYNRIKNWLRRCNDLHHATCQSLASHDLQQIKLVNAETREIVVYPSGGCDYIALSYVWGNVTQPAYKLGDVLPRTIPATLEDALVVTRCLGKQYLWADSLCIEQGNAQEMATQIPLMSAIYTGAWVTIINLTGQSAESGLPRVGTLEGVIPQRCHKRVGGWLLSTMPTLAQQVSRSLWDTRAWTYQEGILSPRRLFFTHHQVYFECNSVQCCESLDDFRSPFHLSSDYQRRELIGKSLENLLGDGHPREPTSILGLGVRRDPFRAFTLSNKDANTDDAFLTYQRLVYIYTTKKMTKDSDSLNAFSAMVVRFGEAQYPHGFVQGLPVQEFPRALLWTHAVPPRRRADFPAWSWAGWEGVIRPTLVKGAEELQKVDMPPLRIWRVPDNGLPELVYNFNPTPWIFDELEERRAKRSCQSKNGPSPGEDQMPEEGVERSDMSSTEEVALESESESDRDESKTGGEDSEDIEELDFHPSWLHDESSYEPSEGSERSAVPGYEMNREVDPVFLLAKRMFDETPTVTQNSVNRHELLIEGIIVKLTMMKTKDQSSMDTDVEDDGPDVHLRRRSEHCVVRLDGETEGQEMRFYGYNAAKVINKRNRKEQNFLLLSREMEGGGSPGIWCALMLVDFLDEDKASRIAVASLRLDNIELFGSVKLEKRMFALK